MNECRFDDRSQGEDKQNDELNAEQDIEGAHGGSYADGDKGDDCDQPADAKCDRPEGGGDRSLETQPEQYVLGGSLREAG